jgi:uncharacterized protein (TIGR02391 family)
MKGHFPVLDDLLVLQPEDLGEMVLRFLATQHIGSNLWERGTFVLRASEQYARTQEVMSAFMEAWSWLEQEVLLIPNASIVGGEWFMISRRGHRLLAAPDAFKDFRETRRLSRESLHSVIAARAWPEFVRNDFEIAVLKAFREIEIAVREAINAAPNDVAVRVMRVAFNREGGPLTDTEAPGSERQATMELFAGAMGQFKNPPSHRRVEFSSPNAAAELLMFASYLMRIVDDRISTLGKASR